jgi:hypothetical protein
MKARTTSAQETLVNSAIPQFLPAWDKSQGVAVHDPEKSILFRAPPRRAPGTVGQRESRQLHSYSEARAAATRHRARPAGTPSEQREALILVGAGGFAYEEAAKIINCAVGTVKSRVAWPAGVDGDLDGDEQLPIGSATRRRSRAEILSQLDRLTPHHGGDKRR